MAGRLGGWGVRLRRQKRTFEQGVTKREAHRPTLRHRELEDSGPESPRGRGHATPRPRAWSRAGPALPSQGVTWAGGSARRGGRARPEAASALLRLEREWRSRNRGLLVVFAQSRSVKLRRNPRSCTFPRCGPEFSHSAEGNAEAPRRCRARHLLPRVFLQVVMSVLPARGRDGGGFPTARGGDGGGFPSAPSGQRP